MIKDIILRLPTRWRTERADPAWWWLTAAALTGDVSTTVLSGGLTVGSWPFGLLALLVWWLGILAVGGAAFLRGDHGIGCIALAAVGLMAAAAG